MNHDVIVVGASAGGLEVVLGMAASLPADLPASIFIVVHTAPAYHSPLPEMLTNRGPLPASHPLHGEKIQRGRIYVAAPDAHLLVREGSMEVVRGARENGHRPAADALFRTASMSYGPRVVGVVLSGYQTCGTAGMLSIKARGGVSVVQAPDTALVPEMPASVLERVPVDHVVAPAELPGLLARLAHTPAAAPTRPDAFVDQLEGRAPGRPVELVCPICEGVLTEAQPGVFEHFRCHVGHTFSLDSLMREQGEEMERALWAAARALEEGAALSARLAGKENGADMRNRFLEKERTQRRDAEVIRQILLHGALLSRGDASRLMAEEAPLRRPRS